MNILWVANLPSPYRVDFFNEIGKSIKLTVLFERHNALNREENWFNKEFENFNSVFLKKINIGNEMSLSLDFLKYIDKKYDLIIISNYSSPVGVLMIEVLKLKKIRFGIVADGGFVKQEHKLKYLLKKHLIHSASFWLSSGMPTNDYLTHYGAKEGSIYQYPFTSIKKKNILERPLSVEEKKIYKKKLAIKEENMILSIGQFIHRKGFDLLIEAAESVPENTGIYVIGGNITKEYSDLIEKLNLKNIYFLDFKSNVELEDFYKASDVFVLPTREDIWGLVINEAMAFGLPVITTNKCIAGVELIKENKGGYIVSPNHEELSSRINKLVINEEQKNRMAQNNLDVIKNYTIENMAKKHLDIFSNLNNR